MLAEEAGIVLGVHTTSFPPMKQRDEAGRKLLIASLFVCLSPRNASHAQDSVYALSLYMRIGQPRTSGPLDVCAAPRGVCLRYATRKHPYNKWLCFDGVFDLATIVGGIASSHTPSIAYAVDTKKADDPTLGADIRGLRSGACVA